MEGWLQVWHTVRIPATILVVAVWLFVRLRPLLKNEGPKEPSLNNAGRHEKQQLTEKTVPTQEPLEVPGSADTLALRPPPRKNNAPRKIVGSKLRKQGRQPPSSKDAGCEIQPLVFFTSLTATTAQAASEVVQSITTRFEGASPIVRPPQLLDLSEIDYEDYFTALPKQGITGDAPHVDYFYIALIPSYSIDTIIDTFLEHLKETHHDFRIDTAPLSEILGYAVFGFGDKDGWPTEEEGFCSQAKELDKWLAKLTDRKRAYPLGMGDVKSDAQIRLSDWKNGVEDILQSLASGEGLGDGVPGSGDAIESEDEEDEDVTEDSQPKRKEVTSIDDLERLGEVLQSNDAQSDPLAIDFTTYGKPATNPASLTTLKEMVPKSSPTYTALTKQGYTIVGSHSGVKICRWTKSALRGRGSCYKRSMYGIASHLCMEATPSLSCSNKCVFCWRHGTNPVGTSWRWQVDEPDVIFAGIKAGHYQKIKMLRGVPGVRAERFEEAMRIRHCALSLVGEPIFYPHINRFTALLHAERISSFLVCNAQHPDQLAALQPVTQLYVSIDASNKASLRRIDRPLHRDFWERFTRCLDILAEKRFRQRTVFRLTLVKGFNVDDEAEGYADLVARGLPCFVEVKGVTYCGTTTAAGAGLTMANVPFYEEVVAFVEALAAALKARGLAYGIAAEHKHSCCILLASERFHVRGRWHTVIDYERFFELLGRGGEFRPEDYTLPTEEWALWGNGGFDPSDVRVRRKGKNKDVVEVGEGEA